MTQLYVGVRDAYLSARLGADKVFPGGVPTYAREGAEPVKSGEDLFRDFGHLVTQRQH